MSCLTVKPRTLSPQYMVKIEVEKGAKDKGATPIGELWQRTDSLIAVTARKDWYVSANGTPSFGLAWYFAVCTFGMPGYGELLPDTGPTRAVTAVMRLATA